MYLVRNQKIMITQFYSRCLFVMIVLLFSIPGLNAQMTGTKATTAKPNGSIQLHSHNAVTQTALIIKDAQMTVKKGKVYSGNLAKAVNQQNLAVTLYNKGEYVTAIHHTRYARKLAVGTIRANRGKVATSMENDGAVISEASPSDADMDAAVEGMAGNQLKDQTAVDAVIKVVQD